MPSRSVSAPSSSRQEALMARHAMLALKLEEEQKRPSTNDFFLRQLKKQKLLIKEELEGLRTGLSESAEDS